MYAKLINGKLQIPEKFVIADGRMYVNPNAEILSGLGYKQVIETEPPEEREGYVLVSGWKETKKQIKQTWDYVMIEQELVPEGGDPL